MFDDTVITLMSGANNKKSNFSLNSDQKSIGNITDRYIIAVPKSGCCNTINTGKVDIAKIETRYIVNLFFCLLSEKNLDKHITYIIFPNSEGCK